MLVYLSLSLGIGEKTSGYSVLASVPASPAVEPTTRLKGS